MASYSISLIIQTPLPSVDFITHALQIAPTHIVIAGTPISSRVPESGTHIHSTWEWAPFPEGEDNLAEQIQGLCFKLNTRKDAFQRLASSICYKGVSVMVVANSTTGQGVRFEVPSSCSVAIGELGFEVWFDVYP
jgi:hypothetical protein